MASTIEKSSVNIWVIYDIFKNTAPRKQSPNLVTLFPNESVKRKLSKI
jgi:hypothetical protein